VVCAVHGRGPATELGLACHVVLQAATKECLVHAVMAYVGVSCKTALLQALQVIDRMPPLPETVEDTVCDICRNKLSAFCLAVYRVVSG